MVKHGLIGLIVLIFACTFMTVIYLLASNGHAKEKIIPAKDQYRFHDLRGGSVHQPETPVPAATATP